ncbi:MAG: class I SAM-dependent methyltransferase [Bdellovibrionales bacterium]|nr:class I SAM-dependent methyltransferase [Bdellovibrionales bacterium]
MLLNYHGREFIDHPELSLPEKVYVWLFGVPVSGMRIRLRRILPAIKGDFKSIIDLGCGKGVFTFELARRYPHASVVGIDLDEAQIHINNQIAKKQGIKNLRFEVRDILNHGYDHCFDLAVSVDNLEHIEDDVEAIRKIRSALRPGGTFVCHVPTLKRIWIFRKIGTNVDVPGHVRPGYNQDDISRKLQVAGFKLDSVSQTYGYLETVSNNLSYLITGAAQKNKFLYALAFPILNFIAWLGRRQDPAGRGAGVLSLCTNPS